MGNNLQVEKEIIITSNPPFESMERKEVLERDSRAIFLGLMLFADVLDPEYTGEDDNPERAELINNHLRPFIQDTENPVQTLSEEIRNYLRDKLGIIITIRREFWYDTEFSMYFRCLGHAHSAFYDNFPQEVLFKKKEMTEKEFKKIKEAAQKLF